MTRRLIAGGWLRRKPPDTLPRAEQAALGKRLKRALDTAMDDAGIAVPPEDGEDNDQE